MRIKQTKVSFRRTAALAIAGTIVLVLGVVPGVILAGTSGSTSRGKVVTSSTRVRNPKYLPSPRSTFGNERRASEEQSEEEEVLGETGALDSEGGLLADGNSQGEQATESQGGALAGEPSTASALPKPPNSSSEPPNKSPDPPVAPRAQFSCKVDKTTCRKGETIKVVLSLTNRGSKPMEIVSSNGSLGFDGVVFAEGGSEANPLCRLNDGYMFIMVVTRKTLAPGQSIQVSRIFPPHSSYWGKVKPGTYYLIGCSDTSVGSFRSQPIKIVVTP